VATENSLKPLGITRVYGCQRTQVPEATLDHGAIELHLEGRAGVPDDAVLREVGVPQEIEV
jgi:hypothetical protein